MNGFTHWQETVSQHTKMTVLSVLVGVLSLTSLGLGIGWHQAPRQLRVYLPPDIRQGAWVDPRKIPLQTVYAFASHILSSVETWLTNGITDYPAQLKAYRGYFSSASFATFYADYERRLHKGTLDRQRLATPPLGGYTLQAVSMLDVATWRVDLTLHLTETVEGHVIKSVDMRYPLLIKQRNVPIRENPWGLVIEGLIHAPIRLSH